jgi:peptidoglycan/LPS O-acetylase OafA/YrhL
VVDQQSSLLNHKYRPDIDGLRALAVLAVIAFHAFPAQASGGFIGVDIFFVISGYLISTIIFENLDKGTFKFSEFYARRIARIFPALILVLVASFTFGWFVLLADEFKQLGKHIAAGAGFISNLVLWQEVGYFDNSAETKPLLHLWSLGIEEQFYIAWPLMVWMAWKRKFLLLAMIIIVSIVSVVLNIQGVRQDAVATFFSPQTRFWELSCGSLLAWLKLYKKGSTDHQALDNILAIVGLSLLAFGFWRINKQLSFPGQWALIPVIGTALLLAAGPKAYVNHHLLSNKIAVWFGLISYPLYLWHWPLLSFARVVESATPSASLRIAAIALAILLAWLTYKFVESPIRLNKAGKTKTAVLVVFMLVIGYVGYNAYQRDGLKFRSSIKNLSEINAEFVGPMWRFAKNDICQRKYPLAGVEKYGWWFCMASSEEKPTLLLLGNSYANHFFPGIIFNPQLSHHSVLSIGVCDAAWVDEAQLTSETTPYPCSGRRPLDQQTFINDLIKKEKSIRYTIIGGLPSAPTPENISGIIRRIEFLKANGITVILFVPHLRIEYDIKACYARPLATPKQDCQLPVKAYDDLKERFAVLVDRVKQTHPDVLFFDANTIFCNETICNFKLPIMPAFRDDSAHLSEFASKLVFDKFVDWAKSNVPDIIKR